MLIKKLLCFFFIVFSITSFSQQMPYYTQYKSNQAMINPATLGTKRTLDARTNYRLQWVGFDDAPKTATININGRLYKETMGLGVGYFNDRTGPTKRSDLSLGYAYHLKFQDVELSVGAAFHMLNYQVDGTLLNMHIAQDNVIDMTITQKKNANDLSAGIYFYNDRFHIGCAALNLLETDINFYPGSDTTHRTNIAMVPHIYGSVGYNWSGDPDFIWENSLQALYSESNPITLDYNLRIHYQQKIFGGLAFRIRDAVALQLGATFMDEFHISYSYDIIISSLKKSQSGSHEIMLAWSKSFNDDGGRKKKHDNSRFKKQKYGFMF